MLRQREFATFTFEDMMGSVGGYAGLFIGWAIYSLVEITTNFAAKLTAIFRKADQ